MLLYPPVLQAFAFYCSRDSVNTMLKTDRTAVDSRQTRLSVFKMNCLQRICGISLRDHVPHNDTLTRCNTFSVESQLQKHKTQVATSYVPDAR